MRWSFIGGGLTSSRYYRADLMVEGLRSVGETAEVWPASFEADDHTIRGWEPETGRYDREPAQVVVARFHGPPPVGELFIRARRRGQVCILELDDDFWAFRDWNPAVARKNADDPEREVALMATQVNMACADVVVASTPTLAEVCTKVLDGIGEPDVAVAFVRSPVKVDPTLTPRKLSPPRVGWLGTWAYRGRDLAMIAPALEGALRDGTGMLRHLGRDEGEPPLPVMLTALNPLGKEPPYPIHEHSWVPIGKLPDLLCDLDFAVVPAEPHRFNLSRSGTTGLALAACGVPFIASPTPEYAHLFDQGVGLLADDLEEWSTLLKDLLVDRDLRETLGRRAREVVADLYAPERAAMEWITIVEAL